MSRESKVHYISPSAISVIANCNGSANDIAVDIIKGAKIKVYAPASGIETDDASYQEWTLTGRNRRLANSDFPYTIYARLSKTDKSDGYLVFARQIPDLSGVYHDKYNYITGTGLTTDAAITSQTHWYVRLGDVSLPEAGKRKLTFDTGILGTDQYNNDWDLNPDELPMRIEIECKIDNEVVGQPPYVSWGKSVTVRAMLVEGWDTDVADRVDHWTIARNTGNQEADDTWNSQSGREVKSPYGLFSVGHLLNADDFDGAVAATFAITAWAAPAVPSLPSDSSSEESQEFVALATTHLSILAETVATYELELSSSSVAYDPLNDEYSPSDGVTVRIRQKAQDGSITYLDDEYITDAQLHLFYLPVDEEEDEENPATELKITDGRAVVPVAAFQSGQNVNLWLENAARIEFARVTIVYVRYGEKGNTPISLFKWFDEGATVSAPRCTAAQWTSGLIPGGWSKTAPNRTGDGQELWMSQNTLFGNGSIGTWSTPVRISGVDGTPGEDAKETEWIYVAKTQETVFGTTSAPHPKTILTDADGVTRTADYIASHDDFVPQGWSDNALPVSSINKFVYASWRKWDKDNTAWGLFNDPILWSNWGRQGIDGDGTEYAFIRTKTNQAPVILDDDTYTDNSAKDYTQDEHLPRVAARIDIESNNSGDDNKPYECTDDAKGVSAEWPFQWAIKRTKAAPNASGERAWEYYQGSMSLWSNWAADGADGTDGNDAAPVQPNILLRTVFERGIDAIKEAWTSSWNDTTCPDTADNTVVLGRKSIRLNAVRYSSNYFDLRQDVSGKLKPSTWYTLSFYSFCTDNSLFATYLVSTEGGYMYDRSKDFIVDGVTLSSAPTDNGKCEWKDGWSGNRHTVTFCTPSTLPSEMDVRFRVYQGTQLCICMPKLEEGKTATAYMPNENDLIGADGANGYAFVVTPENSIVNQSLSNTSAFDGLPATFQIYVLKGSRTCSFSISLKSYTSGLTVSRDNGNVTTSHVVTWSGVSGDITTGQIVVTLNVSDPDTNTTFTKDITIKVYINRLGEWSSTVADGVETSISQKLSYVIWPGGEVHSIEQIGTYIKGMAENISTLSNTVNGHTQDISRIEQTADHITLEQINDTTGIKGRNYLIGSGYMVNKERSNAFGVSEDFFRDLPDVPSGETTVTAYIGISCYVRISSEDATDGTTAGYYYNLYDYEGGVRKSGHRIGIEPCFYAGNTLIHISCWALPRSYTNTSNSTYTSYKNNTERYENIENDVMVRIKKVYAITYTQANKPTAATLNQLGYYNQLFGQNSSGTRYHSMRSSVGFAKMEILTAKDLSLITAWCPAAGEVMGDGINLVDFSSFNTDSGFSDTTPTPMPIAPNTIDTTSWKGYFAQVLDLKTTASVNSLLAGKIVKYWVDLQIVSSYTGGAAFSMELTSGNSYTGIFTTRCLSEPSPKGSAFTRYYIYSYMENQADYARPATSINRPKLYLGFTRGVFRVIDAGMSLVDFTYESALKRAGIDIRAGVVTLFGDRVTFASGDGIYKDKVQIDPETGTLYAVDGKFSGTVTVDRLISNSKSVDSSIYNNWPADSSYQNTKKMPLSATGFITTFNIYGSGTYQISLIGLEGEAETGQEFTFLSRGTATIKLFSSGELKAYQQGVIYSGNNITLKQGFPVRFLWTGNEWCIIWGYFES